jgi:hypothetical protein
MLAILTLSGRICLIGWISSKKGSKSKKNNLNEKNQYNNHDNSNNDNNNDDSNNNNSNNNNDDYDNMLLDIVWQQDMLYDMKSVLEIHSEGERIFVCMVGGIDVLLIEGLYILICLFINICICIYIYMHVYMYKGLWIFVCMVGRIPEKEKKKKHFEGLGCGQPLLSVCPSVGENRFHILRPGKLLSRAL